MTRLRYCGIAVALWLLQCVAQESGAMQHITEPTFSQLLVYATPSVAPEGILILLHGCNHGGLDWENLPVEKTIVSAVLSHGLVAVAPTSVDRDSRCWSEDDIDRVKAAITFIRSHLSLPNARVFLLGASSGGSFALRFARLAKGVSAICMQISYGRRGLIGYNTPTLLVHMPRDNRSADVINKQIQTFRAEGIPADEFKCEPKSLSGGEFFYRSGALSEEDSKVLTNALVEFGYLNARGHLLANPRESDWRKIATTALPHIVPSRDTLVADESAISEVLNVAYAVHEITAEYINESIIWLKQHGVEK